MTEKAAQETQSASKKDYRKANLKGKSFQGEDLRGANFQKAKLTGADLTGADLSGADFSGANLSNAVLADVKANETNFSGAVFDNTTIKNLACRNSDFTKSSFRGVTLEGLTDEGGRFGASSFSKCRFKDVAFAGSDFKEAIFFRSQIENGRFEKCSIHSIKAPATRVENSSFKECAFTASDLLSMFASETVFAKCDFSSADLAGLLAAKTSFTECNFTNTELTASEFKESRIESSEYKKSNFRYVVGLSPEFLAEVKAGGGKVSKYLLRRFLKWCFMSNTGRAITAGIVILSAIISITYVRNPSNWSQEKLLDRINQAERSNRMTEAVNYYKILLGRFPAGSEMIATTELSLANAYLRLGQIDLAENIINRLVKDETLAPVVKISALGTLATININRSQFDPIEDIVKKIIQSMDQPEPVFTMVSQIAGQLVPLRQVDLIDKIIQDAWGKFKDDEQGRVQILLLRARVNQNLNRFTQAIADFEQLKPLPLTDEQMQLVLMGLGSTYRMIGDHEKSRENYQTLAKIFPEAKQNIDQARMSEVQILRGSGRNAEAEPILRQVMVDAIDDNLRIAALGELINLLIDTGRQADAERLLKEAAKNPNFDKHGRQMATMQLSQFFQRIGNTKESIQVLSDILDDNPDSDIEYQARSARMGLYSGTDMLDKAIEDGRYIVEKRMGNGIQADRDKLNLGELYARLGRYEEAMTTLGALSKPPVPVDIIASSYRIRIDLNKNAGKKDVALELINAMEQADSDPYITFAARILKTEYYANSNKIDEAKKVLVSIRDMELPFRLPENTMRLSNMNSYEQLRPLLIEVFRKLDAKLAVGDESGSRWVIRTGLASLLMSGNQLDDARKVMSETLESSADINARIQAGDNLAHTFIASQDYEEARNTYKKMLAFWPDREDVQFATTFGLADIERAAGNEKKSVEILKDLAAKCNEDNMQCCRVEESLLQNYKAQDDINSAKEVYKKVLAKYPNCWLTQEAKQMMGMK